MLTDSRPIGVFDSGMGGLTVLKEIVKRFPYENTIYYADAINCPYGEKSREQVIEYTDKSIRFLIDKDVKIIVIACNTATSSAIDYLRTTYDIEFVAMEPAIKPAATSTKTGIIGVLATKRTIEGDTMKKLYEKWSDKATIISRIGSGLVDIVERNAEKEPLSMSIIREHINYMADNGADKIVLGCTHYPFLESQMLDIIAGRDIELINPAPAISIRVGNILSANGQLCTGNNTAIRLFYSSSDEEYNIRLRNRFKTCFL